MIIVDAGSHEDIKGVMDVVRREADLNQRLL